MELFSFVHFHTERIRSSRVMLFGFGAKGAVGVDRSKQYRKNAADSLMLSHEAMTSASQQYWLTMAEFWFRLAQHVEESEAASAAPPNLKTGAASHR
jgi:hypothetical protein